MEVYFGIGMMKKTLLTGIAALFLATGAVLDYRPQYDVQPWETSEPLPEPLPMPNEHRFNELEKF
jgi:hypothetical protein